MNPQGSSFLNQATLVLNRSWAVVNVTTVRRAICLVFRGHAKIIAPETFEVYDFESWVKFPTNGDGSIIHAVSFQFQAPEVIVLKTFNSVPNTDVPFSRKNIFRRDNYTCQYCGKQFRTEELTIEHILPRSKGGKTTWQNCVLACISCNLKKGNRTLTESGLILKKTPTRPRWKPDLFLGQAPRPDFWGKFL